MKRRRMTAAALVMAAAMAGASVCYAAAPAEGFDPGDGVFSPNGKISRQDMAKIVGSYAGTAGIKLPEAKGGFAFTDDSSIKDYAKGYIYQLNEAGILLGYDNSFHPTDLTTRAASAGVLAKLLNY